MLEEIFIKTVSGLLTAAITWAAYELAIVRRRRILAGIRRHGPRASRVFRELLTELGLGAMMLICVLWGVLGLWGTKANIDLSRLTGVNMYFVGYLGVAYVGSVLQKWRIGKAERLSQENAPELRAKDSRTTNEEASQE